MLSYLQAALVALPLSMVQTFTFRQRLVTHLAAALLAIGAVIAVVALVSADTRRRAADVSNLRQEVAFRNQAIAALGSLRQQSAQARGYTALFDTLLPIPDARDKAFVNFRKQIQTLAAARSLTATFAFGEQVPASVGVPPAVRFDLIVTGPLSTLLEFLSAVEALPAFVAFDTVDLGRSGTGVAVRVEGRLFSR